MVNGRLTGARESQDENCIIRRLIENPKVDCDAQADLLYKLAGQMIAHLSS